jgi:hypothetical protein
VRPPKAPIAIAKMATSAISRFSETVSPAPSPLCQCKSERWL